MPLPKLPDLDFNDEIEKPVKKQKPKQKIEERKPEEPKHKIEERKKIKIPKTKYDSEGNPILAIPDLNDVNLVGEIDKYFGNNQEG